jgi:pimeloyl-ACP methyl ester carboxylesterase
MVFQVVCAYALPQDELSSVGLMCSAGPWKVGTEGVPLSARLGSWASVNCPSLATQMIDTGLKLSKRFAASKTGKTLLDTMTVKAAAAAGKEISDKDPQEVAARRERLVRILLEPFAQGSRGFVQEAYILTHPYGFRIKDVKAKVQIWHGTKDVNSPIRMVRYLKDRLPNCELHELEGETHFTIQKYLEEIVTEIVKGHKQ